MGDDIQHDRRDHQADIRREKFANGSGSCLRCAHARAAVAHAKTNSIENTMKITMRRQWQCMLGILTVAVFTHGCDLGYEIDGDLEVDQTEQAVCSGTSCNGRDPRGEGCNVNVIDGAINTIPGVMTVRVRETASCGGVKWAHAQRASNYAYGTYSVWLENSLGNEISGSRYTIYNSNALEIYGQMWTGGVRACALVSRYSSSKVCTVFDP